MNELRASLSMLTNGDLIGYFFKGVAFTGFIAVIAINIGAVFGSILALVRNYCNSGIKLVFKWLSVIYIEVFRNTPLMLWLFICLVSFPVPSVPAPFAKTLGLSSSEVQLLFKSVVALVLFTSSVMAEIIRGGLNAVDKGQFEGGYAQVLRLSGADFHRSAPGLPLRYPHHAPPEHHHHQRYVLRRKYRLYRNFGPGGPDDPACSHEYKTNVPERERRICAMRHGLRHLFCHQLFHLRFGPRPADPAKNSENQNHTGLKSRCFEQRFFRFPALAFRNGRIEPIFLLKKGRNFLRFKRLPFV
jgi:His/Glu/Gln/Arg/opine family amino acid ABC transporter permease subunit